MKPKRFLRVLAAAVIALPAGLFAADADLDGLDDAVETNTGTYLSPTNTGTQPNNPDSDGDGAGDWYEVATIETNPASSPQPNAPNNPGLKPNIPYPLPAPDASTGATNKPVKVYILSGQSNMVGQGNVSPLGTAGTLETITRNENKFPNLRNGAVLDGAGYTIRNDVMYRGVIAAVGDDKLKVGQGGSTSSIGPELGFGHVMGYYHDEPVLILKSSQGGRALGWDFLPPGSAQYTVGTKTWAGYGDSPASWDTGSTPVPDPNFYGGYQYDQCFLRKADWAPAGAANAAVFNVTDVLDNWQSEYAASGKPFEGMSFEVAGFAWFQGWNDGLSYTSQYANRYEVNMAQFIRQVRAYYESRYPGKIKSKSPFVIATCAFEGWNEAYLNQYPTRRAVINAQFAVSDPVKYPEFAGNVKTMEARGFWRDTSASPANQGYHYNRNAETFMLVGDALGRGMIDLLASTTPDTTPPAVAGFNPADNASGVAAGANLVLTFNESVVLGTGNLTLKNLTDGTQSTIAITDAAQVSVLGAVLTINPAADLAAGKSYALQVDAAAVRDLANNPFGGIADDTTWNFTTALPDTTAPTPDPMTWATPPAAASSTSITMTATTATDPSGVQYFFDCTTPGGHDSAWQDSPTYTDTGLTPSTSYTYQVKARDKSTNNNETGLSSAESATTSAPDLTAPAVSTLSPADNSTGVALASNLVLTFNEPVAVGTGNITIKNLTDGTQSTIAITDTAKVSLSGAVVTINPTADLAGSKDYAIRIDAGAVRDLSNNPFAGIADDTTWNFTTAAPPANAEITIVNQVEGFLGSTKTQVTTTHNGTTQVSYDATGVDKLVVAIGTESGFNNNSATVTGVKFNDVALTQAVQENTIFDTAPPLPGDWDGGTAAIYYLDDPYQGSATFSVSATTSSGSLNGGWVSIFGLAGTSAGVGNTGATWHTQTAAGNVSTSLATSAGKSLVIAMVENSGRNNGAGLPTVVAPLTLSNNGNWGSQWGSGASGYQIVPASGTTITPTFTTNAGGNIHVIAAEFLAAAIPASAYQTWASQYPGADLTDPSADHDGGGLDTGIEWVTGGDPTTGGDDAGLAPTIDTTTDPDGKVRFTYRRSDASNADPNTTIAVQYGGELTSWTAAAHQGTGAGDITITEAPDGTGFARVTVAIPRSLASGGRLFARLMVVVATP